MDYFEFLNEIIHTGKEAVEKDYVDSPIKKEGALAGFEACKDKTPEQLSSLLTSAHDQQQAAFETHAKNYWSVRCFEAEVEWVCNCVSAFLIKEGQKPIYEITTRGMLHTESILNK